jgi:hypothetical protein
MHCPSDNEGNVSDTPRRECNDRVLSEWKEGATMARPEVRTNVLGWQFLCERHVYLLSTYYFFYFLNSFVIHMVRILFTHCENPF